MIYSIIVFLNLVEYVIQNGEIIQFFAMIAIITEILSNIIIPFIFGMNCDKLKELKNVCSQKYSLIDLSSLDLSEITVPD